MHLTDRTQESPTSANKELKDGIVNQSPSENSERSDNTIVSPQTPEARSTSDAAVSRLPSRNDGNFVDVDLQRESVPSQPLNTDLPSAQTLDRSTPRAQTVQEAEEEWKRRSDRSMNLEGNCHLRHHVEG